MYIISTENLVLPYFRGKVVLINYSTTTFPLPPDTLMAALKMFDIFELK